MRVLPVPVRTAPPRRVPPALVLRRLGEHRLFLFPARGRACACSALCLLAAPCASNACSLPAPCASNACSIRALAATALAVRVAARSLAIRALNATALAVRVAARSLALAASYRALALQHALSRRHIALYALHIALFRGDIALPALFAPYRTLRALSRRQRQSSSRKLSILAPHALSSRKLQHRQQTAELQVVHERQVAARVRRAAATATGRGHGHGNYRRASASTCARARGT